jgi:DNA-binding NtrC family response regulator
LQEREVVRIGSRKAIPIDVRLLAATSVDLDHAVSAGQFRRDLFYRLNTVQARLPPLRERSGDVLPLVQYFLQTCCRRMGLSIPTVSRAAIEALLGHSWPGNIRELENVIHFALLMCGGGEIQPEHLTVSGCWGAAPPGASNRTVADDAPIAAQAPASPFDAIKTQLRRSFEAPGESLFDNLERLIVMEAYQHCGNNQVQSAALLGISRNVLRTLLKRHGLLRDSVFPADRALAHGWSLEAPGH